VLGEHLDGHPTIEFGVVGPLRRAACPLSRLLSP
jgi:hypothetical protein